MKKTFLPSSLLLVVSSLALLSGCETQLAGAGAKDSAKPVAGSTVRPGSPGNPQAAPAAQLAPQQSPDQVALREGIELYNKGDFNDAIKRLGSADIAAGPKAGQVSALKHIAFSYCVTNRTTLCRQTFEKAFKLDPSFDLAPGEHGHPLWGKSFQRAKGPAARK